MGYIPGPDLATFGESQRELSTALNLTNPEASEAVNDMRHRAALAAPTAKLAKVPVSPGEHLAFICKCQSLGVPAAAADLHDPVSCQALDLQVQLIRHSSG